MWPEWWDWVGLAAIVVGFVVTFFQIRQAKSAASAASEAAADAMREVSRRLFAAHASEASRLYIEFLASCRNADWNLARFRGDDLRDKLSRLTMSDLVSAHNQQALALVIDDLGLILANVEVSVQKGQTVKLSRQNFTKLQNGHTVVSRVCGLPPAQEKALPALAEKNDA